MVREALRNALPPPRREPERAQPRLEPVKSFSDAMLEADRRAPRKQRHTAHRIYQRLRTEQRGGRGRRIARAALRAAYVRGRQVLDLEHYLDVLYRRSRAPAGATPLAQRAGWAAGRPATTELWG
jgi:hypothetical protein